MSDQQPVHDFPNRTLTSEEVEANEGAALRDYLDTSWWWGPLVIFSMVVVVPFAVSAYCSLWGFAWRLIP